LNLNDKDLEDVDIGYIGVMYFEDIKNLKELSLNLENNKIGNDGLLEII